MAFPVPSVAGLLTTILNTVVNTVFSVHGFFRLANFGIFIALVIYLYHRYVKDFIASHMRAQEAVFEGLVVEQTEAIQLHDKYAQEVARAAQSQAHMQRMMIQWQAAVEREHAVEALEKSNLLLARKQKAELLAEQLRKQVIAKRVMPDALLAARHKLQEAFDRDQEGAKMVQNIMAHITSHTPSHTQLDSLSGSISGTRGGKS